MKLFIAEDREQGYISDFDYHWCDSEELLMFGQFQTEENRKGNEVSMVGIQSRKFTTHILVKDLDIPRDFFTELVVESVERAMDCVVDELGNYIVDFGEGWGFDFNVNDMVDELIEKASNFEHGDKLICKGRKIWKKERV